MYEIQPGLSYIGSKQIPSLLEFLTYNNWLEKIGSPMSEAVIITQLGITTQTVCL